MPSRSRQANSRLNKWGDHQESVRGDRPERRQVHALVLPSCYRLGYRYTSFTKTVRIPPVRVSPNFHVGPRLIRGGFCLFCAPHGKDKVILNGRNDASDVHDCDCFPLRSRPQQHSRHQSQSFHRANVEPITVRACTGQTPSTTNNSSLRQAYCPLLAVRATVAPGRSTTDPTPA